MAAADGTAVAAQVRTDSSIFLLLMLLFLKLTYFH